MPFCTSCGKSVDADATFCPFCGHNIAQQPSQAAAPVSQDAPSPAPPAVPAPNAVPKPEVPLTQEQVATGDRYLTSAVLNFLFWGVGYYNAGIRRPFERSWLIWPIIYVIYAFIGLVLFFMNSAEGESSVNTTIPIGNSTTTITTTGFNPFPGLLTHELEILALLIPGIILGLFLARDVYRRSTSSAADPSAVPSWSAAVRSVVQRSTAQVNLPNIEREPATAFSIVGGLLLILGSLYLTVLDWLSGQTFNIGGIRELEGAVLGALVIYLAIALKFRPGWRQPGGIFIIAMALVELTISTEYLVELGFALTIIGGALAIAANSES